MKRYCAIAKKDKWIVATIGPCSDFHPVGDTRPFSTFEEANTVALDCSRGKYGYIKGQYVNMR